MKITIILATTERRFDGRQYAIEQLLDAALYLNQWGEREYNKAPSPLPQFLGYPHDLRAWVTTPQPGGPAVLYVQGWATHEYEKALIAARGARQHTLMEIIAPLAPPQVQ